MGEGVLLSKSERCRFAGRSGQFSHHQTRAKSHVTSAVTEYSRVSLPPPNAWKWTDYRRQAFVVLHCGPTFSLVKCSPK
jgi:hypothetical protein